MKRYIQGDHREQSTLFPPSVEEFIPADHLVRVLDAFVEMLDMLSLGFNTPNSHALGRPGYDPRDLLKLYLYGYMHRVRSSRELEKQCQRNIEVMWLINRLSPDHKTIADFRKDNKEGVRQVFRTFIRWCKEQQIIAGEYVSIDGSKFKAVNSKERNVNKKKLNEKLRRIDKQIEEYLKQLDQADTKEAQQPSIDRQAIAQSLRHLQNNRQVAQQQLAQLHASGQEQLSLTDADARAMRSGQQGTVVGYNVQCAVDSEHHLMVAVDVNNQGNDRNQLSGIAEQAKDTLQVDTLHTVSDAGYSNEAQVAQCAEQGITASLPPVQHTPDANAGKYSKDQFHYDEHKDCYHCPQGQSLTYRSTSNHHGRQVKLYRSEACRGCGVRAQCTDNQQKGREIARGVHEHLLEQANARYLANPRLKVLRKSASEHPFGTLKTVWQQGYFLTRGLKNVKTEITLSAIAYNLKRLINIIGVPGLLWRMQCTT